MRSPRYLAVLALLASGCWFSADEHVQACSSDDDCAAGFHCYADLCLEDDDGAGIPGEGCPQGNEIESCYDGSAATRAIGACQDGQRVCVNGAYTECLGQVLPRDEVCNGKDDDCNSTVDDVAATSGCDTHLQGACAEGSLTCRNGVEFCQPMRQSQTESCNGSDDDCDGSVDEVSDAACYPEGVEGCAIDSQGSWQCYGRCATGILECSAAEQTCAGAMTPMPELCTEEEFAQDENCDGEIDENCSCVSGSMRGCYAGPEGTHGHGRCRAGTQTCVNTEWEPCFDQIVPSPESCENQDADDDCNDVVDDVPGRGATCIASDERGACRDGTLECVSGQASPQCVGGSPTPEICDDVDQDCDGDPTNGYDLASSATCGACDVRCSLSSETCCDASCVAPASLDTVTNCGACGNACGEGQYCCQGDCLTPGPKLVACACTSSCGSDSCCDTTCRDLQSDKDHCGACGRKCGRGEECVAGACQ